MNDKTLYAIIFAPIILAILYAVYLNIKKSQASINTTQYYEEKFHSNDSRWV